MYYFWALGSFLGQTNDKFVNVAALKNICITILCQLWISEESYEPVNGLNKLASTYAVVCLHLDEFLYAAMCNAPSPVSTFIRKKWVCWWPSFPPIFWCPSPLSSSLLLQDGWELNINYVLHLEFFIEVMTVVQR